MAAFAVAFSLYSAYMVGQISQRQEQLEQTQWELYANESRRLAGEAMDVASEDLELAMLLTDEECEQYYIPEQWRKNVQ